MLHKNLTLKNVAYMPTAPRNIISLARLLSDGYDAKFSRSEFNISLRGYGYY